MGLAEVDTNHAALRATDVPHPYLHNIRGDRDSTIEQYIKAYYDFVKKERN